LIKVEEDQGPSSTEYGMAAILSYSSVYFISWLIIQNPDANWVTLVAYPVYFIGALYPAYLLSSRAGYAHLMVGIKSAFYGWLFSGFSLWVLTGTASFIFLLLLLICFILGGFSGAYVALKRQIRKEALEEL
jgi:cbb3-type cytochrome oxidase subunit 3